MIPGAPVKDSPAIPPPPAPRPAAEVHAQLEAFAAMAHGAGFQVETFAQAGAYPLLAATRRARGARPRCYLSAGVHGDEPAGPAALAELWRSGFFDDRAHWTICPMLNPRGVECGTRETPEGVDLNRDYRGPVTTEARAHVAWLGRQPRYELALCLHEDWEAAGFYLYEINDGGRPSLAPAMLGAAAREGPLETAARIDGHEAAEALIRAPSDPAVRERWPEAIYLRAHHTWQCYTTESPSARPLPERVAMQVAAVRMGLEAWLDFRQRG